MRPSAPGPPPFPLWGSFALNSPVLPSFLHLPTLPSALGAKQSICTTGTIPAEEAGLKVQAEREYAPHSHPNNQAGAQRIPPRVSTSVPTCSFISHCRASELEGNPLHRGYPPSRLRRADGRFIRARSLVAKTSYCRLRTDGPHPTIRDHFLPVGIVTGRKPRFHFSQSWGL